MNEVEILNYYNEWWSTRQPPAELYKNYHRDAFLRLKNETPYQDTRRIVSLVGPRQTGKTTLLYQLINLLLEKKIKPSRILFLSLSDPALAGNQPFFEKILKTYENVILRESLKKLSQPVYFFLDEIQYLDKWELWLKRYYDLGLKIKFIISGSASSRIIDKGRESLAGRISETRLYPLSFREFLKFQEKPKLGGLTNRIFIKYNGYYHDFLRSNSFTSFGNKLLKNRGELAALQDRTLSVFNQYFEKGGFPGVYQSENTNLAYRYLNQDILDRVTAQDIPRIAEIRDVRLLQTLILTVAQRSGSIFSYRNLASESGARSETIRNYLLYLRSAFLASELWQFRKAESARLKANKKFYICDLGLRHAILKYPTQKVFSAEEKGVGAETLVFNHLNNQEEKISFWRQEGLEVDFVVDHFGFVIPIEVKYQKTINRSGLRGLKSFMEKYKTGGIIVTENTLDYRDNQVFLPLWLYLFIC